MTEIAWDLLVARCETAEAERDEAREKRDAALIRASDNRQRAEMAEEKAHQNACDWADMKDRAETAEQALREIRDYYEAVYAPGDQAYQAAIVARAALAEDTR